MTASHQVNRTGDTGAFSVQVSTRRARFIVPVRKSLCDEHLTVQVFLKRICRGIYLIKITPFRKGNVDYGKNHHVVYACSFVARLCKTPLLG